MKRNMKDFTNDIYSNKGKSISKEIENFINIQMLKNLSEFTIANYSDSLLTFSQWLEQYHPNAYRDVWEINTNIINEFLFHRSANVGASTMNLNIRILKLFFGYLHEAKRIKVNPTQFVKKLREDKKPKRLVTVTEYKRMLKALDLNKFNDVTTYTMITLLWNTGIRANELCQLQLQDVDLIKGFITIQKSKNRTSRIVPLTPEIQNVLQAYLKIRGKVRHNYLFVTTRNDSKMTVRQLEYKITNVTKKCKIENVSPHSFRHTFISRLMNKKNANPIIVARIVGHSDFKILSHYTQIENQTLMNAVLELDDDK